VRADPVGYVVGVAISRRRTMSEGTERDRQGDEQLQEAEAQVNDLDEAKEAELEDEREHAEGAETRADLDEEAGQANRPGTERPPV
jgi:hypothetical protein